MGLRCSLLGHEYGDVVVEREQDERGSEIVVTVRELRECRRCSAESIVSENTEVRRRRPEDDRPAAEETTADESADEPEPIVEEAEASAAERERANEDAIILDDTPDDDAASADRGAEAGMEATENRSESAEEPSGEAATTTDDADVGDETPAIRPETDQQGTDTTSDSEDTMDDVLVAEEESEDRGNEQGADAQTKADEEWPDEPSEQVSEPEPNSTEEEWPTHPESDPRPNSSPSSGGDGTTDDGFQFEESPRSDETDEGRPDPASGIKSAGPIDLTGPPDGSLDGILHCPACGYSVAIARSSNRAGDICPDCHAGYLAEER